MNKTLEDKFPISRKNGYWPGITKGQRAYIEAIWTLVDRNRKAVVEEAAQIVERLYFSAGPGGPKILDADTLDEAIAAIRSLAKKE